jgi:catechol 2,3-dioxygenase-like lactoylglutathione lyase family enzyme
MKQSVVPALRISDEATARAFYVDRLGFRVEWEHRFQPNLPIFMQVARDGMMIFLTQHRDDCPPGALVHLYVDDVDAWYAELQARGVPIHSPPSEEIDGLRDMLVLDPDGNKLRFCTLLADLRR